MKQVISFVLQINVIKTLYVNFKAFSLRDAFKFPILCFNNVSISGLKRGGVKCPLTFGSVKIGAKQLGFSDCRRPVTKIVFGGNVIFLGRASIGSGCYIDCSRGSLQIGNNFRATGFATILTSNKITFGADCLVSWDTLIMDTDAHSIYLLENDSKPINPSKPIMVGDKVWVGARATILKGVTIKNSSIIASNCCVTKDIEEGAIVASTNQKVIKNNIMWDGKDPD